MRRFVLPCLLGVLAAVAVAAAPAFSRGPLHPHAVDFAARVALPAAASGGPVTTRAISAPKRFDLVGFRWKDKQLDPKLRIRVRKHGGKWSHWVPVASAADHGAPGGSDPVWAGGDDEYQLKMGRRPAGLRAHFVNATGTATRADRLRTAIQRRTHAVAATILPALAHAAAPVAGAPKIVPRSGWDPNGDCKPKHAPTYGKVKMAFVHHTVSANSYGPDESAAMVLSICRYHEDSNGWWDIGYNFLVDRYGKVFEGRAGGTTRAVIGAQAQGYNSVSTGISNLGTFSSVGQTSAGLSAMGRLIGWKLALHHLPTTGKITVESAGGPTNRYSSGTSVTLNRISGHRDGDETECPGTALYDQLPQIRKLATAAAGRYAAQPSLQLLAKPVATIYPSRFTFSGSLTLPGGPSVAGRTIALQKWTGRKWQTWATATTDAAGAWTLPYRLKATTRTRAYWGGADGQRALASEPLSAWVKPKIALTASRTTVPAGGRVTVRGRTSPWKAKVTVRLQRKIAKQWKTVQTWKRMKTKKGRFSVRPTLSHKAPYRVIATTATDKKNAAGKSKALALGVKESGGGAGF